MVDGYRFAEIFDFQPTPLVAAIDAALVWYRQQQTATES